MRILAQWRTKIWRRNERLGFPIWLPLLLGVMLFLAANLLAGERQRTHHRVVKPVHTVSYNLIAV